MMMQFFQSFLSLLLCLCLSVCLSLLRWSFAVDRILKSSDTISPPPPPQYCEGGVREGIMGKTHQTEVIEGHWVNSPDKSLLGIKTSLVGTKASSTDKVGIKTNSTDLNGH